jgi:hypothetical protein
MLGADMIVMSVTSPLIIFLAMPLVPPQITVAV